MMFYCTGGRFPASGEPWEGEGAAQDIPQGFADGELCPAKDEPQLIPHGENSLPCSQL